MLAEALVQGFVRNGKARPVLPAGRRDEVVAALTELLIEAEAMDRYLADLDHARLAAGVHGDLLALKSPELPAEEVVARGVAVLDDDRLADLAIDPIRLAGLFELLGECMEDGTVGEVWIRALADAGRANLESRNRGEAPERHLRWLKVLEDAGEKERFRLRPVSPRLGAVLRVTSWAAAALLLISVGFYIGSLDGSGVDPLLVASTSTYTIPVRGGGEATVLEVTNGSERAVFVTVVGLIPDRGAVLYFRENRQFLRIESNETRVIQGLPGAFGNAESILVIVSTTPLGDPFRDIDLGRIPSESPEEARETLTSELEHFGYRGFLIESPHPISRVR